MKTNDIINQLRDSMKINDIDAYIVPTADPHGSEYIPDYYKDREFLTGFTGSNGLALVTKDEALLWTDGRYFIQAERQIADSEFKLMKLATPGYDNYEEYLKKALNSGSKIAVNGLTYTRINYENLVKELDNCDIEIEDKDLISPLWVDRPELPKSKVFVHKLEYSGKSSLYKITEVRDKLREDSKTVTIISSLDDIAWLCNIRGGDIESNPVVMAYVIVSLDKTILFSEMDKFSEDVKNHLSDNNIELRPYDEVFEAVSNLKNESISLNKLKTNQRLYNSIDKSNTVSHSIEITTYLKAVKNPVELENQKQAYIRDGAALTKYIYWLKNVADLKNTSEFMAAEKLTSLREEQDLFVENSFNVISAYGSNAAMMHYSATKDSTSMLDTKGLYLVDSGGQYLDGTTDITRTIALGPITDEERRDFTLVLKSHFALVNCIFLEGSSGYYLDAIARYPIWQHAMDYKCGTGHGVGYLLNVHEGPHRISPYNTDEPLKVGNVVTIEPGIYKEDQHGIRTENVVYVKEHTVNSDGRFLEFEVMSYAPIDIDAIDTNLLTEVERDSINSYNNKVYEAISPFLEEGEKIWLKDNTRKI